MKRLLFATTALATCLFSATAQAQTWQYGGVDNGNYNESTNWTTNTVPDTAGETATFANNGPASVTVTLGPISPQSWTFSANAQSYFLSGQAVNFVAGITNNANAGQSISISNNMTGSVVSQAGASTLTLSGTSSFTSASVTAGTLHNSGSLTTDVSNSATFGNSGTLTGTVTSSGTFGNTGTITGAVTLNAGTATNGGAFQSALNVNGGAFTNNVGGSITGLTSNNGGTVTNNGGTFGSVLNTTGTFDNTTGNAGSVINFGTATNGGTISGLSNDGGTFSNTGTVSNASQVSAGAVTNAGAFSNNLNVLGGSFTNNVGGSVAGNTSNNGGTITNNGGNLGNVTNTTGTFNNTAGNAGTVANAATATNGGTIDGLSNTGGTFGNAGTVTSSSSVGGGAVTNTGTFSSNLNVSGTGSFTNNAGGSIAGPLGMSGTGSFLNNVGSSVSGTTTITGGTVTNNGGAFAGVTNTSGTFTNTAGTVGGPVTNSATFNANGGAINGAISNNAGGTFNVGGTVTSNSTFDNSATNSRLVLNTFGTYTLSGLLTNSGTDVSGGVRLNILSELRTNGGFTNNAGATIVNLFGSSFITNGISTNNGTITGNLNVSGGTLSGIGSILGSTSIASAATLAAGSGVPGSSMTFGTLTLQPGATYSVSLNPTTSSFVTATGVATLGSATVNASFAAGSYAAKQYTIVTAGSVSGTFNPAVVNSGLPSGFNATLSYDPAHAYLNLALNFAPPSGQLNGNQQNVGNAIVNFFNSNGSIPISFGGLTPAGLTQLSGEGATASQQSTFSAMNQFMGVLTDPFIAGRGDPVSAGGGAAGYADEALSYAAKRRPNDALAAIYTKAPPVAPFAQRWSVWGAGFGGSQRTDGNAALGSNDTRSSLYGTAVGLDYRLSPNTLAGFALAGGGTNFSVNGLGSGRSDLFQAGAFLRHNAGPAYVVGALAYGWQNVTTDRTVTIAGLDQLRAKFNANAWSGRLEGGYRVVSQGFGWTPYAAGQFTTFDLPAYAEQVVSGAGTFALTYAGKTVTATRTELGLRSDKSIAMQDGVFTLRGRLAWAHDYNANRTAAATFQTLPGASFVVNGATMAPDAALTTASAEWKWLSGWSAAATFEGEFSNVTRSYAGKGVVRYAW